MKLCKSCADELAAHLADPRGDHSLKLAQIDAAVREARAPKAKKAKPAEPEAGAVEGASA